MSNIQQPQSCQTTTPTLRTIQRKLEKLELEHLREFITQQAAVIDDLKDSLKSTENNAEYWRESWFSLTEAVSAETNTAIGLTKTGEIGLISTPQEESTCAIGECWPGTEAIYAGRSISIDGTQLVHLILWPEDDDTDMDHVTAVAHAESVNPDMGSHLPTRIQYITLFGNLKNHFDTGTYYWSLTKTDSGNAAFGQRFHNGIQSSSDLSYEGRVRAVSEIPL